ncbi:MAG: hypothetical protein ACJ77E_04775 [Gaiellaceae bacterium]
MLRRILLTLLAALVLPASAGAGTIVVRLKFVPGKVTVKAAPATVSGSSRVALTVADGRGTGAGWTLKAMSRKPLTVLGITARCAAGSTCTLPAAVGSPSGAVILRAARGTGMGVIDIVVTLAAPSGATAASFTVTQR